MVSDPKFVPREISTKYVKRLGKNFSKDFDGGDVSVFDMHEEMDGKQDVRLFLRSIQYVVGCIFGDEAFADCMVFTFHPWPASIKHAPDYKGDILRYGDEQLHVLKDHRNEKGRPPLCYVDTGYRGRPAPDGCEHQAYMVYNGADLVWARRLQFHLRRFQA
jgi:hypothetical protein